MLTNEEIEQMKGVVRKCIYGIPDNEGQVARDTLGEIVNELLALREATAPKMAEVDALMKQIEAFPHVNSYEGAKKLSAMLRTAILASEQQKQRADEAERVIRELKDNFGEMEVGA